MLSDKQFWKELVEGALYSKAEYNFLDFKLKLADQPERMKEHINAFGNLERGGCFVFGVEKFIPVGITEEWDSIITKISHYAKNTQEPNLSIDPFPLEIDGKKLLCIHVLSSISKPVFIKDRAPLGGSACYTRSGSSTIPMSIQEIKDLLSNSSNNYYDEAIVENAKLEDLDFEIMTKFLPQLDATNHILQKNVAILKDQHILINGNGKQEITVAGWLCFAKDPQKLRLFRNAYIELQVFHGSMRDVPLKKYDIKGSLPRQIEQAIQLLQQNIWVIPKIHGVRREDIPAYDDKALREVVTNSLVHRDYRKMPQPVKIAIFDNRIEIENPGSLMPGLTIYNLIHKRDWRNPLLAELMKKFGFGEMDGQGIDRLYTFTLALKVPPPTFINNESSFTVILSSPKEFEQFTPNEKKFMVMILAVMHSQIDNEIIRDALGTNSEKAGTLIKAMVADKILQPNSSSRKYAKYTLTEQYREKFFC